MKCLFLHNRRPFGPRESSWFTFHYISKELDRRGHLLGQYSLDYHLTDVNGKYLSDTTWNDVDTLITVYKDCFGPLSLARVRGIPSFLEINYACPETVNVFMLKELKRLGLSEKEILSEAQGFGQEIYELPTFIIGAGNQYTENTYREHGINNVKMFKAGIDCDNFVPDFTSRGKSKIRFTFTAAVINFRKGIYHVMEAWRYLDRQTHEKIELHIFGDIPSDNIREMIKLRQKEYKNIYIHGFMPNTEKEYRDIHATADCMLCPTLAEGQSGTALEGVAFGLYAIVSPYTGLDFDKIPSTILSFEPAKWVKEIADSIIKVTEDYENIKKLGPIIRDVAVKNYTWEDFSRSVVNFIEEIQKKYGR